MQAATWLNPEDIMLSEPGNRERTNPVRSNPYKVSGAVTPPHTESRMGLPGLRGGRREVLLYRDSLPWESEQALEMDGSDSRQWEHAQCHRTAHVKRFKW